MNNNGIISNQVINFSIFLFYWRQHCVMIIGRSENVGILRAILKLRFPQEHMARLTNQSVPGKITDTCGHVSM